MSARYVAGFVFNPGRSHALLIRKARPSWQAGLWNAIGGHIEPGEFAFVAMIRECREECGLQIPKGAWQYVAHVTNVDEVRRGLLRGRRPEFRGAPDHDR